jgi:hypothetical protein
VEENRNKKKTLTVSDDEATKSTPQQLKTTPKSRSDLAIAIISNQSQEQRDATNKLRELSIILESKPKSLRFFFKKKGGKKNTLDKVHDNNAYLSPLAKEREKRDPKPDRTLFSPLRRFFGFLRVQCAFVFLSFLFPRAAKCKSLSPLSLSLSLSLPPSLPPGALFTPGANGLRGQAWPQPMGKRGD